MSLTKITAIRISTEYYFFFPQLDSWCYILVCLCDIERNGLKIQSNNPDINGKAVRLQSEGGEEPRIRGTYASGALMWSDRAVASG